MKISVTFLKNKLTIEDTIEKIENTDADFIHVDVMDGCFVDNKFLSIDENVNFLGNRKKPLDVHLMVKNPIPYIDLYAKFNPEFITIHKEIDENIDYLIDYIHDKGIKAGIAINPETPVEKIEYLLEKIEYIIIMGVTPGYGGQSLIKETIAKIEVLKSLRKEKNYSYLIALDGGVNKETRIFLDGLDILIVGSYISLSDDFQKRINEMR